jgi:DNA-binding GntR family transcriptional regulator
MKPLLQIDPDMFREWLLLYFDRMRDMELEVFAYRLTVEALKKADPDSADKIGALTEKLRQHEEAKGIVQRYERHREELNQLFAQSSVDQALAQYLQGWKAKGPIN